MSIVKVLEHEKIEEIAVGAATAGSMLMTSMVQGGWQTVIGTLTNVSVGSASKIWGVNSDKQIFKFRGAWTLVPAAQSGGLTQVSAASDGTVWGLNGGKIFRLNGSNWDQIPAPNQTTLAQISVGSATKIWGVDSHNLIFTYNVATQAWDKVDGTLKQVSVASDGTVWGFQEATSLQDAKIFRRSGRSWIQVPEPTAPFVGPLAQISVGSATQVWGVTKDGSIAQYTGDDLKPWVQVPGTLSDISVASDGTIWGLQIPPQATPSVKRIYYFVPNSSLSISDPRLLEANLAQGEHATYQFQVTNTAPGTTINNLSFTLGYDQEFFTASGVTVGNVLGVPGPLKYGQSASPQFTLDTTQTATKGTYAFDSVRAAFTSTTQNVPVDCESGGWMAFKVSAD
jgi:virginiamycin B lyase